jgi:hypothetical protein
MTDTSALPAPALLNGERLYSFTAIAVKVPGYRDNSHANSSTIIRWVTKGVKAPNGRVIRLEAVRVGAAWKTSLEAVARFSAALTEAALPFPSPSSEPLPTPKQRRRAAEAATKKADAIFGVTD